MKEQRHPLPTSEEVDRRLRIVAELRNLCLSLGQARPIERPCSLSLQVDPEIAEVKPVSAA